MTTNSDERARFSNLMLSGTPNCMMSANLDLRNFSNSRLPYEIPQPRTNILTYVRRFADTTSVHRSRPKNPFTLCEYTYVIKILRQP